MANLQDIMKANRERLEKSQVNRKPSFTKAGAEDLLLNPTSSFDESKFKNQVKQEKDLTPQNQKRIESDSKAESDSVYESGSKSESASKKNLFIPQDKIRNFNETEEFLSRDENRLLKFIREKVSSEQTSEVVISKSELVKFANINTGRIYNTRSGLIEKKLIIIKERLNDKNRKEIVYSLIQN